MAKHTLTKPLNTYKVTTPGSKIVSLAGTLPVGKKIEPGDVSVQGAYHVGDGPAVLMVQVLCDKQPYLVSGTEADDAVKRQTAKK